MTTIGLAWADGAWIFESWAPGAWAQAGVKGRDAGSGPWWENIQPLPYTLRKPAPVDELPHKAAIEEIKADLRHVRPYTGPAEVRALSSRLGGIVRSANALEKKIEKATEVAEVAGQYRVLGLKLHTYRTELDGMIAKHRQRLEQDDADFLKLLMEMD